MTARVVLVGERLNHGGLSWNPMRGELELSLDFLLSMGAFKHGPAHERLVASGMRWDAAFNLLMPAGGNSWSEKRAREVAAVIRAPLFQRFDVAVLLGVHVASAFDVPARLLEQVTTTAGERFLVIPHPGGRSRFWEREDAHERVRRAFEGATGVQVPTIGAR